MRNKFDKELQLLNNELIEMGALVETAINEAAKALLEQDRALAEKAVNSDSEVNEKEKDIERRCFRLLLQQQPVAADLRAISTALKMITDMERIGDQAQDISEITIRLCQETYVGSMEHIPPMAEATIKMVTHAVDAFVAKDLEMAHAVIAYDDVVDNLFIKVKDDLIALIREDPKNGEQAIDLLMVAKYFERIGDHATNIAEWVVFSITGEHENYKVF